MEEGLQELFEKIAIKHGYENASVKIKPVSSNGANYSSVLFFITISAPNKESLELFAKVIAVSEESRAKIPIDVYDIESFAYGELAEKFNQIEDRYGIPEEDRYVFCKYYGFYIVDGKETVVLENLTAKGFVVHDRMISVDWPYASKSVEELAKFHALSIVYGEEYPEVVKHRGELFARDMEPAMSQMDNVLIKMSEGALKVTKEENKERLAAFFKDHNNMKYTRYSKPVRKTVMIHGDYRPSNLMHKENEDGTIQVIPLDFQTIRPGCMVSDLMYFIFSSSDEEFRAKHYEELVELYYEQLCRSLRVLDRNPEKEYPREDFEFELKAVLPYGLVLSVMMPILTVEPEDAPDIQTSDLFESMATVKQSNKFPDRLNGIVNDFVRWGVI